MKALVRIVTLASFLTPCLFGLNLKVERVDREKGQVQLLLPMHSILIDASVFPEGERIGVEPNRFYEGKIVTGAVKKTKRYLLRVKIPHRKPVKLVIEKISFIVP